MPDYINRNVCLETVLGFINNEDGCDFDLSTALEYLQYDTTCPNKCNVQMYSLNSDDSYSLKRIYLTKGDEIKDFKVLCSRSSNAKTLYINCGSWNESEYKMWYDANDCSIKDAQCVRFSEYCICHCMPGYGLVDDKCLKRVVNVGGICKFSWQCIGAGACNNGSCSCSSGYTQIDGNCYPGKLKLNDLCELTEQCIQPFSHCFQGKCKCINGYFALDTESCIKDTVPVGGFCSLDKQCTGSNNSGICKHGRCACGKEFTRIDLACIKRNLELNDSCDLTEECIQPFSVCCKGKCKCITGYSAFDTDSCIKDTVPVGGFCNLSQQCTGSNNSGICENGRCTCAKEFTVIDFACEKK